MRARWQLGRAGIVNVYQYADETLHFADGRLLLRGVNGSGKSTAMNMLLPFLLDGDTRRIDAAGEQAGVLRSWMLAGRDDPQPVGYLWLELARGEDHLTFGCGIKANRSTDTVTTWWFITSRRPGVDLDLVEARQPLSVEALRSALGGDPVFRHDQRGAYRAEIRARLFGGADIDQHIRLLHVVRNPRVGDRIERELPEYLVEALPQLSEAALDDAAQPLEDLEEHRRNVEELRRTDTALLAVQGVYRAYVRGELRQRAMSARELVETVDRAIAALADAEAAARHAAEASAHATREVMDLEADERRLRQEIDGLRASPAYRDAQTLHDLQAHVATLARAVARATDQLQRRSDAAAEARLALTDAIGAAEQDRQSLAGDLEQLAEAMGHASLACSAPDAPALSLGQVDADHLEPVEALAGGATRRALQEIRGAVLARRNDVDTVRVALEAVAEAEQRLERAALLLGEAVHDAELARHSATAAREVLDHELSSWRGAVEAWVARLRPHHTASQLEVPADPDLGAGLLDRRHEVVARLTAMVDATAEIHLREEAATRAQLQNEQATVDELAVTVAELDARTLPPPPAMTWQRPGRGPVLAEVVDFDPALDDSARAGLEAALEASGILGAELQDDASLQLADGTLVARAGTPVAAPLGAMIRVAEHADGVDTSALTRLLDSVSTDPDVLGSPTDTVVVTTDGRFRIGVLLGRHAKARAEHVGVAARRAALERQRAEARRQLDAARADLAATGQLLAATGQRIAELRALRSALPTETTVSEAVLAAGYADTQLAHATEILDERRGQHHLVEQFHAEAVDASRRTAASVRLPPDDSALSAIDRALGEVTSLSHRAEDHLAALERAVTHCQRSARAWRDALAEERGARLVSSTAETEHASLAARLAALHAAIGASSQQILEVLGRTEHDLEQCEVALLRARQEQLDARGEAEASAQRAEERRHQHQGAADRALAALPWLRRTLAVPGLLDAALDHARPDALLAPVDETPEGLRSLCRAIEAHVLAPERPDVSADSVRQSLRQRRDTLGSGWDAEDRQGDEAIPMAVEVNGPEGRMTLADAVAVVHARLGELSALLSADQDDALRNLLHGLVAREVAEKMRVADELVALMNRRLDVVTTSQGIGVSLRWRRRDDLAPDVQAIIGVLAKPPDLRLPEEEDALRSALTVRLDEARHDDPEAPYRDLIAQVLDYRSWHDLRVVLHRPGRPDERLTRRSALSEGEKKIVTYLPLFAAVAASCDSLAESAADAPRFVLLDDAFAKVSEDNHPKLFGLLVELDLDFIATSERLWGTHSTVPALAITEVLRDADLGVIVLEHSHWDGTCRSACG